MHKYIGEIAALLTAIAWTFTSIFFAIAAKQLGATVVNRIRLFLATILLCVTHYIILGNILPTNADTYQWLWLGISGVIGLVIGDGLLLQAFVIIGARLSMLLMSLVPIISTLLAWFFLGEYLELSEVLAIIITIGGISWVILDKKNGGDHTSQKKYILGILFAMGGAFGQALALVTAKKALINDFPALSANLLRVFIATILYCFVPIFRGNVKQHFTFLKDKSLSLNILGGSFFGPFVGIWLSMIAIKYANIGISSTLMALPPVFILPLTYWIFKEKVSYRSAIGTLIAVVGVAIIFLM